MLDAIFLIPLAPVDEERVNWTIDSIRRHCSAYHIYVLADGPRSRFSRPVAEADDVTVRYSGSPTNRHWGRIWQMLSNGLLEALKRDDMGAECIFVKIDADALVVRPGLIERAQALFRQDQRAGQLGQFFRNIVGEPLENKGWASYFARRATAMGLAKAMVVILRETRNVQQAFTYTRRLRRLMQDAHRNGYPDGCFAIGGAYILRRSALEQMMGGGWLTESPFQFFPNVQEDVIITPHVYAAGFSVTDDTEPNGIFAICGVEPWIHPEKLKSRGYYIVHPTKYGVTRFAKKLTERELVDRLLGEVDAASN